MNEPQNSAMLVWAIYLSSSLIVAAVFFRITKTDKFVYLSSLLRAMFLAVAYTPWYATEASERLAPALMVFTLDLITGAGDPVRSLVPLLLSIFVLVSIVSILRWRKFSIFGDRRKSMGG